MHRPSTCAILLTLLLLLLHGAGRLSAATQDAGTSPLQISIDDLLETTVNRTEVDTGSPTPVSDSQYYSSYNTFLYLDDANGPKVYTGYSGSSTGFVFTATSNTSLVSGNTTTVTTVVTAGNKVQITHTLTYVDGTQQYQHTWLVQNLGSTPYSGVALRYGGDTYYHGADQAVGFYNGTTGLLYCTDPSYSGFMGMQAGSASPASSYYEDGYGNVWTLLEGTALGLPDTVNPTDIDNGMGLEWDKGALNPGGQFTITATEIWDDPTKVVVNAPSQSVAPINSPTTVQFQVTNAESQTDTFALSVLPTAGLTVGGITPPGPISLGPGASQAISVVVTIDGSQPQCTVSLIATSTTNAAFTSQGAVLLNATPATVTAPAPASIVANMQTTITYTVTNVEASSDTFQTSTIASNGDFTVVTILGVQPAATNLGPLTCSIRPSPSAPARACRSPVVVVMNGTVGDIDDLTLSVSSVRNFTSALPGAGDATITISLTGGSITSLPRTTVPVSTPGHIDFFPICPSTDAGISNLLGVLSGAGRDAVGYCWDAAHQGYVRLPSQPSGGILPTTGVFVASSLDLGFDFSGVLAEPPVALVLSPGWNLIGIPPVDTGAAPLTSFAFPGDFTLLDSGNQPVSSLATFANTLGTVGSSSAASADPYFYNGTSYTQIATLQTGTAYWIKNNSAVAVTLLASTSGVTLSRLGRAPSLAPAALTYTDRGQPPPMPKDQGTASSGGSCGVAGGSAVIALLAMLGRRRRRGLRTGAALG